MLSSETYPYQVVPIHASCMAHCSLKTLRYQGAIHIANKQATIKKFCWEEHTILQKSMSHPVQRKVHIYEISEKTRRKRWQAQNNYFGPALLEKVFSQTTLSVRIKLGRRDVTSSFAGKPLVVRQATPSPLIKCNQILHLLHQQTHSLDSTRTTSDLFIDTPSFES